MSLQANAAPVFADEQQAHAPTWPDWAVAPSVLWASARREAIEALLCRRGAVLFRGVDLPSVAAFEGVAEALSPGLHGTYGDLPKKEGGRNESWPSKQWFFCEQPSRVGGATPLADIRQALAYLPSDVVARFESKRLMYSRTFTAGVEPRWESFFGAPLQLRTQYPAVTSHPFMGEELREDLLDLFGLDRLPRQLSHGDGSAIADSVMALIGDTYEASAARFDWRKGDVVMLDNMLAAHARDPYEEPRLIVVAMGEMTARDDVWQPT